MRQFFPSQSYLLQRPGCSLKNRHFLKHLLPVYVGTIAAILAALRLLRGVGFGRFPGFKSCEQF